MNRTADEANRPIAITLRIYKEPWLRPFRTSSRTFMETNCFRWPTTQWR
jgi:hypothetical protein